MSKKEKKILKINGEPKKGGCCTGRHEKFKPEYCQKLIDLMTEGYHVCNFCAEVDICKDTFYHWINNIQAFSDAYKKASIKAEAWWTNAGRQGMLAGSQFNAVVFMMNMRNRFDWKSYRETYKPAKIKGFKGSLGQKIKVINKMLEEGLMSADVHATIMKSIASEAAISAADVVEKKVDKIMDKLGIKGE